ncbi:hypothetical protein CLV48_101653 [Cecembia rubra]|uniref:Uncharacterized protein n=1 Tax=Cecembia rubra TaxID=1485585 RepID=A0A2P8EE16_9BACT|nr:hypothetical protein CLV48_101653 [Cecembia rubra]
MDRHVSIAVFFLIVLAIKKKRPKFDFGPKFKKYEAKFNFRSYLTTLVVVGV